jgi:hypothetical protein
MAGRSYDELFLLSKKPYRAPDATVLKSLPGKDCSNDAPERRIQGVQTVGEQMAFPQKVLLSFAVVIICGSSVLALPVRVAALQSRPVVALVPEPLPLACRKQHWTNADRGCLSWTAPREKTHQATTVASLDG